MRTKGLSLQAASDYIGAHYKRLLHRYYSSKAALFRTSFGDAQVEADVRLYADAMDYWPLGNLIWSFETKRYFGDAHMEVMDSVSCDEVSMVCVRMQSIGTHPCKPAYFPPLTYVCQYRFLADACH